jgi:hypothetical protein
MGDAAGVFVEVPVTDQARGGRTTTPRWDNEVGGDRRGGLCLFSWAELNIKDYGL